MFKEAASSSSTSAIASAPRVDVRLSGGLGRLMYVTIAALMIISVYMYPERWRYHFGFYLKERRNSALLPNPITRIRNYSSSLPNNSADVYLHPHVGLPDSRLLELVQSYGSLRVWSRCFKDGFSPCNMNGSVAENYNLHGVEKILSKPFLDWRLDISLEVPNKSITCIPFGYTVEVYITGTAILRPKVFDLLNGSYSIFSPIMDLGKYSATISLRWRACQAFACDMSFFPTRQIIRNVTFESKSPFLQHSNNRIPEGPKTDILDCCSSLEKYKLLLTSIGRWLKAGNQWTYEFFYYGGWSTSTTCSGVPKNMWLYLIGDSLMMHNMRALVALMEECLSEKSKLFVVHRDNGNILKSIQPGIGMELYIFEKSSVSVSYTFFPDRYPVGGRNFKSIYNASLHPIKQINVEIVRPRVEQWIQFFGATIHENSSVAKNFPDIFVYNFGLHYARNFDPFTYEVTLADQLAFLSSIVGNKQFIWSSTAYTHFTEKELVKHFSCRTPSRIEVMNELAESIVRKTFSKVSFMPFEQISASRYDASPDNRHYTQTVTNEYSKILLRLIESIHG
mmetsp:Transcript_2906/g.5906  ORF Transcript_2906/g.5906 Transcript_2906/m.5906 type:complete len:565 (+) Transcript_2906:86-1780(+)